MKKALLILSVLLAVFLLSGCETIPEHNTEVLRDTPKKTATQWDEIVQRNELRIGVPSTDPSFDNDLIDAFAEELGISVTKIIVPWDDSRVDYLKENRVDMLWGQIPATADTSATYRLSAPYCSGTIFYIARTPDITLSDSTIVGAIAHSAEESSVKGYYQTLLSSPNTTALFSALNSGRCEVVLCNKTVYETLPQKSEKLHVVKEVPYELVVAFEQNNLSVATEVEKILAKIKANTIASEICLKWYPADFITK